MLKDTQKFLDVLEGALVEQFRTTLELLDLLQTEKAALTANQDMSLENLALIKAELMQRLASQEQISDLALKQIPNLIEDWGKNPVHQETIASLHRLHQGIYINLNQAHELSAENQALAAAAFQDASPYRMPVKQAPINRGRQGDEGKSNFSLAMELH